MARILLAEDDEDMRRFLARALENAGYQVVSFNNGRDAYDRLREEPFHLLLTDIVMPEMDGIELARKASELDPDLKIMFITGFAAVALNPDMQGAARREDPVEAVPSQGSGRRDRAADRRLSFGHAEARLAPVPASLYTRLAVTATLREKWARSSAGEHYVDIVGVTGSIPVAPTIPQACFLVHQCQGLQLDRVAEQIKRPE